MVAEKLPIAVTPELAGQAADFHPECREARNNIIVVKRFESKTPIETSCAIDKNLGILVSSGRHAVTECNVNVYDV
jgi:hypothetical protein